MSAPTEERHPGTGALDEMPTLELLQTLNAEDALVAPAVQQVLPQLAAAVDLTVERDPPRRHGALLRRRHLRAAGGHRRRRAAAHLRRPRRACSSPTTPAARRRCVTAVENVEDDAELGARDAEPVGPGDVAVGLTASGRTPYVAGALARRPRAGRAHAAGHGEPPGRAGRRRRPAAGRRHRPGGDHRLDPAQGRHRPEARAQRASRPPSWSGSAGPGPTSWSTWWPPTPSCAAGSSASSARRAAPTRPRCGPRWSGPTASSSRPCCRCWPGWPPRRPARPSSSTGGSVAQALRCLQAPHDHSRDPDHRTVTDPAPARPGPAPPAPSRHGPPRTGDSPMIGTTRRHLTALTVATAVVALAACAPSSSSTSGSSSGGSDGKGVTLSVWSWRTEDVAAYDAIFDVVREDPPGRQGRLQGLQEHRVQPDPHHRPGRLQRPRRRAGAVLRPAPAHHRLREPRAAGQHGRPEQLGRQRGQERRGQGGRQALRRAAGPADAADVLQQGPLRQAGPDAADDVDAVHRGQRQARGAGHHADGGRRQGLVDAAHRAPGAGRATGSAAPPSRRPC